MIDLSKYATTAPRSMSTLYPDVTSRNLHYLIVCGASGHPCNNVIKRHIYPSLLSHPLNTILKSVTFEYRYLNIDFRVQTEN
jgi:hypothetical protein